MLSPEVLHLAHPMRPDFPAMFASPDIKSHGKVDMILLSFRDDRYMTVFWQLIAYICCVSSMFLEITQTFVKVMCWDSSQNGGSCVERKTLSSTVALPSFGLISMKTRRRLDVTWDRVTRLTRMSLGRFGGLGLVLADWALHVVKSVLGREDKTSVEGKLFSWWILGERFLRFPTNPLETVSSKKGK